MFFFARARVKRRKRKAHLRLKPQPYRLRFLPKQRFLSLRRYSLYRHKQELVHESLFITSLYFSGGEFYYDFTVLEMFFNDGFGFFNNMIIIIILSTLSIISNATGFPGGLFIPLLSIGALLGKIFCITLAEFDIVNLSNTGYFVLIGMSVFLISVVRTPLTGFILISERTGNYELLFPTLVVGILTYIFTEIMRVKGLDDILYDMMFSKNQ